jgi:hypothetical protein
MKKIPSKKGNYNFLRNEIMYPALEAEREQKSVL